MLVCENEGIKRMQLCFLLFALFVGNLKHKPSALAVFKGLRGWCLVQEGRNIYMYAYIYRVVYICLDIGAYINIHSHTQNYVYIHAYPPFTQTIGFRVSVLLVAAQSETFIE